MFWEALCRVKRTVSPCFTLITGPGAVPLNVQALNLIPGAISWTVVSVDVRSTLTTWPVPFPSVVNSTVGVAGVCVVDDAHPVSASETAPTTNRGPQPD